MPTPTSYALLSSPWRPKYLSENADAGHKQRKAGLPEASGCRAPRRGGRPWHGAGGGAVHSSAGQTFVSKTPLNLQVFAQVISTVVTFKYARAGGWVLSNIANLNQVKQCISILSKQDDNPPPQLRSNI